MELEILDLITLLIFLAATFTLINITLIKLPSTIGLMFIALGMSVVILVSGIIFPHLTDVAVHIMEDFDFEQVLLHVMLSFLLFAGALSIDLSKLVEERLPILALATFGVIVSTFIVGFLMFEVFQWVGYPVPLTFCLLFGALISPTDPIAVLALIKKANLSKNLEIKIAGESLFNDGIGVVVFLTILGVAKQGTDNISVVDIGVLFGTEVIGGLGMGAILGFIGFKLLDYIENDHVELEVLVTLSLVMGGNRIAELIHVSGPLAMVTMGLFIGNEGRSDKLAQATGEYVYKFWHLLDEALNAILFILIGLEMIVISQGYKLEYLFIGIIAIAVVLFARLIGVSIPIGIMSRTRKFEKGTIAILTWGGLRGGLSVAMALSLPDELLGEFKDLIVVTTYSVVLFSIMVQGLTISKLIKN
ncbi:MAG: sodium:proton antiporter [Cyclobacteriaceae bacterium]